MMGIAHVQRWAAAIDSDMDPDIDSDMDPGVGPDTMNPDSSAAYLDSAALFDHDSCASKLMSQVGEVALSRSHCSRMEEDELETDHQDTDSEDPCKPDDGDADEDGNEPAHVWAHPNVRSLQYLALVLKSGSTSLQ